jgi:hypothetical protein
MRLSAITSSFLSFRDDVLGEKRKLTRKKEAEEQTEERKEWSIFPFKVRVQ